MKKLLSILLSLAMVFALAACGSNGANSAGSGDAGSGAPAADTPASSSGDASGEDAVAPSGDSIGNEAVDNAVSFNMELDDYEPQKDEYNFYFTYKLKRKRREGPTPRAFSRLGRQNLLLRYYDVGDGP